MPLLHRIFTFLFYIARKTIFFFRSRRKTTKLNKFVLSSCASQCIVISLFVIFHSRNRKCNVFMKIFFLFNLPGKKFNGEKHKLATSKKKNWMNSRRRRESIVDDAKHLVRNKFETEIKISNLFGGKFGNIFNENDECGRRHSGTAKKKKTIKWNYFHFRWIHFGNKYRINGNINSRDERNGSFSGYLNFIDCLLPSSLSNFYCIYLIEFAS